MSDPEQKDAPRIGGRYAGYVTVVLVIVYVFNFIDRQIVTILAEEIKADLGISDAQIGFLYGTAFAVFYAIFGIPLGRLADTWTRKNLIAIGIGFWSLMTALSGTARSFASLAAYRDRCGHRRGQRDPGGVLDAVRLLSAGNARHRARDLFERHLHRGWVSASFSGAGSWMLGRRPIRIRLWRHSA